MALYANGADTHFSPNLLAYMSQQQNEKVRDLLKNCDSPLRAITQLRDSSQATLLHYASRYGNRNIAKELIDLGSDVDAQDKFGRSPLALALRGKHATVIEALLEAGAKPEPTCTDSELQTIFELPNLSPETVRSTLKHVPLDRIVGAIGSADGLAHQLYHRVKFGLSDAVSMGHLELTRLLLERGYHLKNDRDPSNNNGSALHAAVKAGNSEAVKLLLDHAADVDALDSQRATPFWYLYANDANNDESTLEILRVLLSHCPNVSLLTSSAGVDRQRRMQIYHVLTRGCERAVELALNAIDSSSRDELKNTALHYVARNGNAGVVELLTKARACDANARNADGYTPLHCAAHEVLPRNVQFLLENGADVSLRGFFHDTPLGRLFQRLKAESEKYYGEAARRCVELLLRHGADALDCDAIEHLDCASRFYDETGKTAALRTLEPLIGHWAAGRAISLEICGLVRGKIRLQPRWVEYFEASERRAQRASELVVFNGVTVRDFLASELRRASAYARNEQLVAQLEALIRRMDEDFQPYTVLLRRRLAKAVDFVELEDKARPAMRRIVELKNIDECGLVAELVVDYLSTQDMMNLCRVWGK